MAWAAVLCIAMGVVVLGLLVKIRWMRRSAKEIAEAFADKIKNDTNTLIDITSHDAAMQNLADRLNDELRVYHAKRRRFMQGDLELKEAVMNISHDLRTPLTAICGYLELLKREKLSEDSIRYLALAEERAEVLKQLTEKLFRYSIIISAEEMDMETIVVNEVLEESLAGFYGAFREKKIVPEIVITDEKVERELDRSALMRVFGNIISNAIKYSDGDLKVVMEETGKITFSNRAGKLTPVTAGRLFDRFYTVEGKRGATGLGLSIAKTLTERMNGRIKAEYRDKRLYVILEWQETVKRN